MPEFQSNWCTECNASLAEEKKETKKESIMNNSVFHTLSGLSSYACLLTLLLYFPAPMVSLSVSILRENPSYKVLASLLFWLKYMCNGPFSKFSVDLYI